MIKRWVDKVFINFVELKLKRKENDQSQLRIWSFIK